MNVERGSKLINSPNSGSAQAISRRSFLKTSALLAGGSLLHALSATGTVKKKPSVVVVGAGAFGGWSALHLLRNGADVLLIDAWGPGNSRASSGGETRVIRGIYGPNKIYVQWVARSFQLWRENELKWNRKVYTKTGALWMIRDQDDFVQAAIPLLQEAGLLTHQWTVDEASKKYPQINFADVKKIVHEEEAGYLVARQSCALVLEIFRQEGGQYSLSFVKPGAIQDAAMENIVLSDGSKFRADAYVFACGPWLGQLFPDAIGNLIRPSRQEVFFFGTPAGDRRFYEERTPVWIDFGKQLIYGIPGNERRGMKIADDSHGPDFDPTSGERTVTTEGLNAARSFLEYRFPDLKGAPLVESRVCQYENSPDGHFLIDRHPQAMNVWIVGGGSGHGFKMGPALGEYVADLVLEKKAIDPFFSFSRLTTKS